MTKNGQLQNGLSDFSATRKVTCACSKTNPSNKRLRCQGSDLPAVPKPASNFARKNSHASLPGHWQTNEQPSDKSIGEVAKSLLGRVELLASCPCPWLKECFPAEPGLLFARLDRTMSNQGHTVYATVSAQQPGDLHFNYSQIWHFLVHKVKDHFWVYYYLRRE